MEIKKFDTIIVGSGLAGLTAAYHASKYGHVAIITKSQLDISNSYYAQGGIAVVTDKNDSFESHIEDTLTAGRGLCDLDAVEIGIRCVAAPSFADIFYENAFRNGLLAAIVDQADFDALVARIEAGLDGAEVEVDLEEQTITHGSDFRLRLRVPAFRREALLAGDDEISATLRHADDIARYVASSRAGQPWLWRAMAPEASR
jgi:hypothetical protein